MKPISIDLFAEYRYPANLKTNGMGLVSFVLKKPEVENDRYEADIWLYSGGRTRQLTRGGEVFRHWWLDADTLVFPRLQKPEDRALAAKGVPVTVLQRVSASAPGEPEEYARLTYAVEDVAFLAPGRFLFIAEYRPGVALAMEQAGEDWEKAAALLAQQDDVEVIQELPLWQEGRGFTGGMCMRLYLYDQGRVTPVTDGQTDVEQLRAAPSGRYAFFVAKSRGDVAPVGDRLMQLDLETMQQRDVSVNASFIHMAFAALGDDTLLVFGSDMVRHGLHQNGAFYRTEVGNPAVLLYDEGEYDGWDALASDCKQAEEPCWFADEAGVLWSSALEDSTHLFRICPETGRIRQLTTLPGAVLEFVPDGDGGVVFTALRGQDGPELHALSTGEEEQRLTDFNLRLGQEYAIVPPEELWFENGDGERVQGWVLRPAGYTEGERFPAVLCIHGGPKMAYGPLLHHEHQYLAGQGYGVLFCNPTGSAGRGDAFGDLRGRYGLADYDDLTRFTEAALEQHRWIDPEALGVSGGSYGGYMVNWIISHSRSFKAAISQRGIANWASMALTSDIGYFFVPDQTGAGLFEDSGDLWEQSPLAYAEWVVTPTLFLHGQQDPRCPMSESMPLDRALKMRGVPARLCVFKGAGHGFANGGKPRQRVRRLREIVAWLDEHLKTDGRIV